MAKFSNTIRLHVYLGERRTTVSVDKILSEYLALHFGKEPGTRDARACLREWAQVEIDAARDPGRIDVSQWLVGRALLAVARPELIEAWKNFG